NYGPLDRKGERGWTRSVRPIRRGHASEHEDTRMVEEAKGQFRAVVVDRAPKERRVHFEGLHQLKPEPSREQIAIVLLHDTVLALRQMLVELKERVVHHDPVGAGELRLNVAAAVFVAGPAVVQVL